MTATAAETRDQGDGGVVVRWNQCWFRDAYKGSIVFSSDAKLHDVDRNDKVYPKPHWDGMFVILVDDADAANPPDREGHIALDGK
jgi:hypothetical protein